nr:phage tail sheath C-terminal domain-containing protein [Parabacteroides goldsteinii]
MGEYKTPGVYIKEKNAFGNSIVEAETAIPVFIGLTKTAQDGNTSLLNKPVRISSMTEYYNYFGGAPTPEFKVSVITESETDSDDSLCVYDKQNKIGLKATFNGKHCTLYYHMILFFANGGGTCYIVSTGNYQVDPPDQKSVDNILSELRKVQDITMLVIPEAVYNKDDYQNIYTGMLAHCNKYNRFAIFDIPNGESIDNFRFKIGANFLAYGAAYYPWLETSVLSDNDIDGETLVWIYAAYENSEIISGLSELDTYIKECFYKILHKKENDKPDAKVLDDNDVKQVKNDLHNALVQNWPLYKLLVKKVKDYLNLLPPSAAMAGIYTMVDNTRGVWKAPANVSVNFVNKPKENIDNAMQADLNMPMNGKAINAIRAFPGEGIKVWGARTLDGNSQDWRYINVRRTITFLEQSVKNAARAYVFEPNDANTWINMKCMIENFLRSVWKRGGLAGASPEDAFEVHVGLGDTMTPEDILDGIMRITVLVAVSRPAEFIEITFQQQMQKS